MSVRTEKVNELIKNELGMIFVRELEFPKGCLVTVTRVTSDQDMKNARVFLSVFPPEKMKEILTMVKRRTPYIQSLLNHKLVMRFVPNLHYSPDTENEEVESMERLMDEVQKTIDS